MTNALTRRSLLATAGGGVALGALPLRLSAQGATDLNFVVWNYSLDTIQDNIAKFEAANPGIKVNVTDYTWPDYQDTMVLRFRGSTPTDVIMCGQDWLPGWALAGWLVPLDDSRAETIASYKDKIADFAAERHDLQGQALRTALLRRHDLLPSTTRRSSPIAGIAVPTTWDEVLAACREAQGRRHGAADRLRVQPGAAELLRAFVAQAYGRGGRIFDDDLKPLFDDPNPAFKQLQWLQDAVTSRARRSRRRTNRRSSRR